MAAGVRQSLPSHTTTMYSTKSTLAGLLGGLVAAVLLGLVAAEAPLPYQYPSPAVTAATILAEANARPAAAAPGYVSPSLLVASPPPAVLNYQPQYNSGYQPAEAPDVHKHVYVHVAPEEPAEQQQVLVVPTPKPKKHYKIVFIKTPALRPAAAAIVNLPQPDQEKTLIYVLSKKPTLQQQLVVSTPAPTVPAKPEVFFIRYKTNEAQPQQQVTYANGAQPQLNYVNSNGQVIRPLTNSYGVPLGTPLSAAQYAAAQPSPSATPATGNINFNTV